MNNSIDDSSFFIIICIPSLFLTILSLQDKLLGLSDASPASHIEGDDHQHHKNQKDYRPDHHKSLQTSRSHPLQEPDQQPQRRPDGQDNDRSITGYLARIEGVVLVGNGVELGSETANIPTVFIVLQLDADVLMRYLRRVRVHALS